MTKKQSLTTEQLGEAVIKSLEQMSPEEKKICRQHLDKAFSKPTPVSEHKFTNGVVNTLRKMKQPVTRDTYAEMAYWKTYRSLTAEEKFEVREAVYEANIQ